MPSSTGHDAAMMNRCFDLAREAVRDGERPFAALVCQGDRVIAQAGNRVVRDCDVTRHAEIVALSDAQRVLGRRALEDCTLYSVVEPCAMCSFALREGGIGRVVFALGSPLMGGLSKWNVLGDEELSGAMPQVFGRPPAIEGGVLAAEAEKVWREWNSLYWIFIKTTGYLAVPAADARAPRPRIRMLKAFLSLFS